MTEYTLDKGNTRDIIEEGSKYGCLRNQLAYILATSQWETANTQEPVKEAYWLDESWRANNLRYYPWYGRGFVQLTWEDNYKRAQDELGLGTILTDDPDKALDPNIAAQVIVKGSMEGWFTGKKVPDYVDLNKSDFINARRVINGTDRASEIASIAEDFDDLLLEEGYGVGGGEEPDHPDRPDIEAPDIGLEKVKKMLANGIASLEDLRERVEELERWRKS